MAQVVQGDWVPTSGGRHATVGRSVRYRGRHRKSHQQGKRRAAVRLAVTAACAGLLVCLPQPSWADRTGTVTTHSAVASHLTAKHLLGSFRKRLRA